MNVEIVDYQTQPLEAQKFADRVETECCAKRRRLGYRGYFNTNGDMILTAYLAGLRATKHGPLQLSVGCETGDGE